MDASNTGYYNPWAAKYALDDEKRNQLAPYMGNLQKFIDENPDSDLIPYAQNARYQKIMGSPELMQQYGDRYRTVDSMSAALRNKSQEIENAMNQIKLSSLPETMKLEAEGLRQEVAAGRYDADTALAQLNQIKSQTRATNALADKRLSGDSGSNSSNKIAEKNADTGSLYSYYQNELPVNFQNRGKGIDDYLAYLQNSNVAPKIISDIGSANYAKLITWARAQVAQAQEAADEYGF